jgi:hypothetical protein
MNNIHTRRVYRCATLTSIIHESGEDMQQPRTMLHLHPRSIGPALAGRLSHPTYVGHPVLGGHCAGDAVASDSFLVVGSSMCHYSALTPATKPSKTVCRSWSRPYGQPYRRPFSKPWAKLTSRPLVNTILDDKDKLSPEDQEFWEEVIRGIDM